jgi:hypothetical protein
VSKTAYAVTFVAGAIARRSSMKLAPMILAILLAMPVFAHAEAFDLVCVGRITAFSPREPYVKKPFHEHLRVDLAANQFCRAACDRFIQIAEVKTGLLTLISGDVGYADESLTVNRISGAISDTIKVKTPEDELDESFASGTCVKKPFSGFPKPKF